MYTEIYRLMRRDGYTDEMPVYWHEPIEIINAADYSYQAKDYEVHGWLSDARRKRFHAIKYRAFAFAEDIPL